MKRKRSREGARPPDSPVVRLFGAWFAEELQKARRPHASFLDNRVENIVAEAEHTQAVLREISKLGPQITWLGSRTLAESSQEYQWFFASACLFALLGFYNKTGKGGGLMMAPHHACHAVNRPDLVIGAAAGWLTDKEADHPYIVGGHIYQMPNFNFRHDVLFHGSDALIVGAGRLGTWHELYDLLNRLKHNLLAGVPVYLVERDGYFSKKFSFSTSRINKVLGPRVTKDDFDKARIIDILETSPVQFVASVLEDLGCGHLAVYLPELQKVVDQLLAQGKGKRKRRSRQTGGQ